MKTVFSPFDLLALAVFLGAWLSHHMMSENSPKGLNGVMAKRRWAWMREMAAREIRMPDAITMQGLQNGSAFFASTSLIAIGGALAALRASDQALQVFANLPFGIETTQQLYDIKALGLASIFAYAFFKFVWAYRLFNYCSILIVSTPPYEEVGSPQMEVAIERAARMNIEAGKHFNRGIRAVFFTLAYLGWFVSPIVLIGSTIVIAVVIWRRQFASEPLAAAKYEG